MLAGVFFATAVTTLPRATNAVSAHSGPSAAGPVATELATQKLVLATQLATQTTPKKAVYG